MYRDRNFDLKQEGPANERDLTQDLELEVIFEAMAQGDKFLREVARKALLSGLTDADSVLYRQAILKDCLKSPKVVRGLYQNTVEALQSEGKVWAWMDVKSPNVILNRSVEVLLQLLVKLNEIRRIIDSYGKDFESEGFKELFAVIQRELPHDYLQSIQDHLLKLRFDEGALIGARLGEGNKGTGYSLLEQQGRPQEKKGWRSRITGSDDFSFSIDSKDEQGLKMLSELREMGVNGVANSLAQAADHVLGFFSALRTELAFYLGCLNLQEQLARAGEPTCFPVPSTLGGRALQFSGLYDASLCLKLGQKVVGNDLDAAGKDLVVVTGANRGGKSTFLRSVGQAQLMMECGCFVAADSFSCDARRGLFTHFRREEDPTMKMGKLEEELNRMSGIVDHLSSDCTVLLNESFSATNQREGSEIGGQIVRALLDKRVMVFFVTHQYDFARNFYEKKMPNAIFLRAERKEGGERTFKIVKGEPLETSYGEDLYNKIFSATPKQAAEGK